MNSPMKPFVPGKPMLEKVITRKAMASSGVTLARPPYSAIKRVCRRS